MSRSFFRFAPGFAAEVFPITAFGVVSDGKTINTAAIQKAINAAAMKDGVVEIPAI